MSNLLWVGSGGWWALPPGTTMLYNVSRPLMQPGQIQRYRAWKYDTSLPYDPSNEIAIGTAMYDTQLLAQQACQNDWDAQTPPVPVVTDDGSGGTRITWRRGTR